MSRISPTTMFILIVETQVLKFVKNFPTKFATKLVESIKPESFSFFDNLSSSGRLLFPGVEDLGGDEPEQAPLVPGLGGPDLLLLDSEVILIFCETDVLDVTHYDNYFVTRLVGYSELNDSCEPVLYIRV